MSECVGESTLMLSSPPSQILMHSKYNHFLLYVLPLYSLSAPSRFIAAAAAAAAAATDYRGAWGFTLGAGLLAVLATTSAHVLQSLLLTFQAVTLRQLDLESLKKRGEDKQ